MVGIEDKFDYFIHRCEQDFASLNHKIDHVTLRVDELWAFKMKLVGIFAAISGLVSVGVSLLTIYFKA